MTERKQQFRFRLPWATAPSAPTPRPSTEKRTTRPTVETQRPAQPTPAQRPPFRPAGIAPPPRPPLQAQEPQKTEAEPPPPASTGPQVVEEPASPATQAPVASSPPTPISQTQQESRTISQQPSSPSLLASQPAGPTASQPSSPTETANQLHPTDTAKSQPSIEEKSQPTTTPREVPTSISDQEPKPVVSEPLSQEPQSDSQVPSETPMETSSQAAGRAASQPSSPIGAAKQLQPTDTTKSEPAIQENYQATPTPSETPTSVPEQEPKPVVSQSLAQEPQSEAPVPSETISDSQSPMETSSQAAGRAASQPSSPIGAAKQLQPTDTTKSEPAIQENYQATPTPSETPTSVPEQEPKPVVSQSLAQEPQSEAPVPSETISDSQSPMETSSQTDGAAIRPTKVSPTSELLTAAASASGTQAEDLQRAKRKQKEGKEGKEGKEEDFDRKEAVVIGTSSSTHSKDRKTTQQKPVVISNGERLPLHEEVTKDITKYVQKLTTGHPMAGSPVTVITLTGENRGASMNLSLNSAEKGESVHIHRGYKLNQDESAETSTDGERSSKVQKSDDTPTEQNSPTKVYINSNIQSVNNSIVSDSSITEGNAGVNLVLPPQPEPSPKSNGKSNLVDTRRAEFNTTPAEKRTYEPTVRRRCLRGLLMESSDSDRDNPEKPRRHGCRVNCPGKDKDKEIGIE